MRTARRRRGGCARAGRAHSSSFFFDFKNANDASAIQRAVAAEPWPVAAHHSSTCNLRTGRDCWMGHTVHLTRRLPRGRGRAATGPLGFFRRRRGRRAAARAMDGGAAGGGADADGAWCVCLFVCAAAAAARPLAPRVGNGAAHGREGCAGQGRYLWQDQLAQSRRRVSSLQVCLVCFPACAAGGWHGWRRLARALRSLTHAPPRCSDDRRPRRAQRRRSGAACAPRPPRGALSQRPPLGRPAAPGRSACLAPLARLAAAPLSPALSEFFDLS